MAQSMDARSTRAAPFVSDYIGTVARLLDPGLPSASVAPRVDASEPEVRWSLGQSIAFSTLVSLSLWAGIFLLVRHFA
jgi:hypothetical protein